MGASVERFEWDANASRVVAEYAKIIAESNKLEKEIRNTAKAAVAGSKEASSALDGHARKLLEVKRRGEEAKKALDAMSLPKIPLEQLSAMEKSADSLGHISRLSYDAHKKLEAMNKGTATLGQTSSRSGEKITQLSFAMDDFMTVAQMQGGWQGIINGARAAGNNLSYVLSTINPLYAVIPSVTTALVGLGYKFFFAGDSAEESQHKMDSFADTLKRIREEGERALEGQKELQRVIEDKEAENRYIAERSKAATERDAARAEIGKTGFFAGLVEGIPGLGGWEADRRAAAANRAKAAEGRIADLDFQENQRKKRVQEQRNREDLEGTATTKLMPLKGALGRLAAASAKEGDTPEQTVAKLTAAAGAVLSPEEARVSMGEIKDIAMGGHGETLGGKLEAALDPAAAAKESLKETNQQIAAVKRERNEAIRQSARGRISKVQEREFDAKLAPLERNRDQLQQAIEDSTKEAQTSNEILKEIRDALKKPAKPTARPIDRNGGL